MRVTAEYEIYKCCKLIISDQDTYLLKTSYIVLKLRYGTQFVLW